MGIRDRDWYRDHFGKRDSAQHRHPEQSGFLRGQSPHASHANPLLGYGCAALAVLVFSLGLAMLFSAEGTALRIILPALWIPAGILALMSFRLLRKGGGSSHDDASSVVVTTLGITTTTPRWQLVLLCVIAVTSVAFVILRSGTQNDSGAIRKSPSKSGMPMVAPSSETHSETAEWRGPDGEGIVVQPTSVKPNGERIRLINNPRASDPTYRQLIVFLRNDGTDHRPYIADEYVCSGFAEDVHNNAENAGIRCALVTVEFVKGEPHSCNLFRTTDRGLVFIDCTGCPPNEGPTNHDTVVDVEVGKRYVPKYLFPTDGWKDTVEPVGVIREFYIHW